MGAEIYMSLYFEGDWELEVVVIVIVNKCFSYCVDSRSEEGEHHHICLYLKNLSAFFNLEV